MKQNLNPIVIGGIIVVLIAGIFFAYQHFTATPGIPPEAREDHKNMAEFYRSQHTGQGQTQK